jgi:hypothetical protein
MDRHKGHNNSKERIEKSSRERETKENFGKRSKKF